MKPLLVSCGGFTSTGDFVELKEFDLKRLEASQQQAVFNLYLAAAMSPWCLKIEPEVVENMRSWEHSGFSRPSLRDGARQSVSLAAGDQAGIERLVGYMTRCPFSLSRLVKVTQTGQVIYKAEKSSCRSFPEATGDGIQNGPKRNYQILAPLDFLAEFTQHIPPKGSHLVHYYGWYSNKSRGVRNKRAAESSGAADAERRTSARSSATWAMLIKRVYELDPLACPQCGGEMVVVAFIEPPQREVIETIFKHCGLWRSSAARTPPAHSTGDDLVFVNRSDGEPQELTYVDMDTFLATF